MSTKTFDMDRRAQDLIKTYLKPRGYLTGNVTDGAGKPIPWYTYPAVDFLEKLVRPEWSVFEYGAGNSTLWWRERCKRVTSVEHDREWTDFLLKRHPEIDVKFISRRPPTEPAPDHPLARAFKALDMPEHLLKEDKPNRGHGIIFETFEAYGLELAAYPKGTFNVVVVDGMCRVFSAFMAANCVAEDGLIIFDNSDRWQYNPGYQYLADQGWIRLDFIGPAAINNVPHITSIYAKSLDALRPRSSVREVNTGSLIHLQ